VGPLAPKRLLDIVPARAFSPGILLVEGGAERALCVDTGYARDHDETIAASRCFIAATAASSIATSF